METTKPSKRKCDDFFRVMKRDRLALSFDDVRMIPCYSEVLPNETDISSRFSMNVGLRIPIVSAAMDTVTEHKMAITMAKLGGLGIIHKALSAKDQATAVGKVKYFLNGFIPDPICVSADNTVGEVLKYRAEKEFKFFSFMVNDEAGNKVGLVTHDDFIFCPDKEKLISEIMSTDMIFAGQDVSIAEVHSIMMTKRKKVLPIFSTAGEFKGIYTLSDVERTLGGDSHGYNLDANGSLRVGAAIGTGSDMKERMELLSRHRVDVVVVDTAHGDSKGVVKTVKFCKKNYPHIDVVAGNVCTGDAAKMLVDAKADGIKVGVGPGSICTTRIVAGIGVPQLTAIYECEKAIRGSGIPICADGGIENSGDVALAMSLVDSVMMGKLLAGTKESPGEIVYRDGRPMKMYRGMGSMEALLANQASRERYGQDGVANDKLIPEGVKAWLNYKGEVAPIVFSLTGGLKDSLGYLGAKNIEVFHKQADFNRMTSGGLIESHPHGLDSIDKENNITTKR
jgi:IMP dehydrogenase